MSYSVFKINSSIYTKNDCFVQSVECFPKKYPSYNFFCLSFPIFSINIKKCTLYVYVMLHSSNNMDECITQVRGQYIGQVTEWIHHHL